MIEEYLTRLVCALERCATALEAVSGKVQPAKSAPEVSREPSPATVDPPASPPPPATNGAAPIEPEAPVAYETLRQAVIKLSKVKGSKIAVSLLAEFGVTTGQDIPPAQYAKAMKRVNELMK